jgi:hypothetical protein
MTLRGRECNRGTGCGKTVRRVTHGRNSHQRWPKFRADDFEVNASPRPERARGQAHGRKAGDNRRRVCCGPATPERYGESWITRTPMSSGATAHSLVARLHTRLGGLLLTKEREEYRKKTGLSRATLVSSFTAIACFCQLSGSPEKALTPAGQSCLDSP